MADLSAAPARWAAGLRALPDFPWDRLLPLQKIAAAHPGGLVDLSVGTPVDPTPAFVQQALRGASNAPGYPTAFGTTELQDALHGWLRRACGAVGEGLATITSIGAKEAVAMLPTLLGLGPRDTIVVPALAYPTYAVGAAMVGARLRTEWDADARLVWVNSPANPTGQVLAAAELAELVARCRAIGALLVSDECYLEFGYDGTRPVSVLDAAVCGGSYEGIVALHSLSKRSNMAGYRVGSFSGDPAVIAALLAVRRHTGFMVAAPVQAAAAAALRDDTHVRAQCARYAARRDVLRPALETAGFRIEHSQAGLYLWATRDESALDTVRWLADRGILCAPGDFYGGAGERHVRIAMTATDERIAATAERLVS